MNDIERFMDEKGRIKTWGAKKEVKFEILRYISTKFEFGRFYSEREVNTLIENWHTFGDYFIIRRGLIEAFLLSRTKSGSRYWKEERDTCTDVIRYIEVNYDIGIVKGIFRMSNGYGSKAYYVLSAQGEYIFKEIEQNTMNHPENEAGIIEELKKNDLPVAEIYFTKSGASILETENRVFHLQKYVEGKIYMHNAAPEWLL
jgi:hypothetical protein